MNLKETIEQHNAVQEYKDDIFTLNYANSSSHGALVKEIKAANSDRSFPFKVQLTNNNSIQYSHFPAKGTESADFADLIQYLDVLRNTLIEMDSVNKIGHIAAVKDDEDTQTFYIDGMNAKESMSIEVTKQILTKWRRYNETITSRHLGAHNDTYRLL